MDLYFRSNPPDADPPGFFESLLGLVITPRSTVFELLGSGFNSTDRKPYIGRFFLLFFASTFLPIIYQAYQFNFSLIKLDTILLVFSAAILAIVVFIFAETLLLTAFGISVSYNHLVSAVAYTLGPLTVAMWCLYLFNWMASGSLTLVTFTFTGLEQFDDKFVRVIPLVCIIAQLIMLTVFHYCIASFGELDGFSSSITTIFSLIPYSLAIFIAVTVTEVARPGAFAVFRHLFMHTEWINISFDKLGF